MKITIESREVYGNRVFYPVCKTAQAFARIAGTKTLTPEVLQQIAGMGYQIDQAAPLPLTFELSKAA